MTVRCDGALHRVRWHHGRIQLTDHPDPEADAVLAAFGGPQPACLELLTTWRSAVADGGFLTEWANEDGSDARRSGHLEAALHRLRREGVQDLLPALDPNRAERMGVVLTELSSDLLDRAALASARRLLRRRDLAEHDLTPWLIRAVRVRARSAFVRSLTRWRLHARPAALVPFHCQVGLGVTPTATGVLAGRDSRCDVVLDARWLLDVWGPRRAVQGGDLVLATDGPRTLALEWHVAAGRPPFGVAVWR
jgi:hypothetical protein